MKNEKLRNKEKKSINKTDLKGPVITCREYFYTHKWDKELNRHIESQKVVTNSTIDVQKVVMEKSVISSTQNKNKRVTQLVLSHDLKQFTKRKRLSLVVHLKRK